MTFLNSSFDRVQVSEVDTLKELGKYVQKWSFLYIRKVSIKFTQNN